MIELIQFPWSPFCIVTRRILEFSQARFKITDLKLTGDRSLVWELTDQRYYKVPVVKDGKNVVFELDEETQIVAKYLDDRLGLGLFPRELEGVQSVIWRNIEHEIEGLGFKLNDVFYRDFVKPADQLPFLRHKERRFGTGCIDQWRASRPQLLKQLETKLVPYEEMLAYQPFLLDERPRFVDFDLYGMLGNFLFSGHYRLPKAHNHLRAWHRRMQHITLSQVAKNQ
ncbi:MAG TPA: glutathione S-transferase C-terminal domain-containing protein [Verrucomicrobiae bacterium]|nr:glutathione S-transferase C-terminal domain-containing protein [Verrucomicrobiae bacterium]